MPEREDCLAVKRVLQRAAVGAPPAVDELEEALAHVRSCMICGRRFELAPVRASTEERDTFPDMADPPVEPTFVEQVLIATLSEPKQEAIVRRRAAERLGEFARLGPAALASLVMAAADDRDETVRRAAERALERLGHVTLLVTEEGGVWNRLTVRGKAGALGEIVRREDQWWMKLNRLPSTFEKTKPVVAVPAALQTGEAQIEWSGESPGLVFAREPVVEGALELFLGNVAEPVMQQAQLENLFSRVYLLSLGERAPGV